MYFQNKLPRRAEEVNANSLIKKILDEQRMLSTAEAAELFSPVSKSTLIK